MLSNWRQQKKVWNQPKILRIENLNAKYTDYMTVGIYIQNKNEGKSNARRKMDNLDNKKKHSHKYMNKYVNVLYIFDII